MKTSAGGFLGPFKANQIREAGFELIKSARLRRAEDFIDAIESLCEEASVNLRSRAPKVGLYAGEHDIPAALEELQALLGGRDDE